MITFLKERLEMNIRTAFFATASVSVILSGSSALLLAGGIPVPEWTLLTSAIFGLASIIVIQFWTREEVIEERGC